VKTLLPRRLLVRGLIEAHWGSLALSATTMPNDTSPERLLARTRGGERAALGQLLELYRNYLRLVARSMIGVALRVKLDPSDLVQETFLKAHRDFPAFAGQGEHELVGWLRKILARCVADQVKHHRRQGRDHQRQESLELLLERSDQTLQHALASRGASPSERSSRREQAVLLADAVSQLPPDYREVFILRTLDHVSFEEIAARIGRSKGAVRMLWTRALERLSRMLESEA
jgi:RNA polymerase sigma-70 factor (ECF subfamily)